MAQAETLALRVLAWLVADDVLLGAFLSQSGLSPADLAKAADDPGLLAGVMEFLAADDMRLVDAASGIEVDPARLAEAAQRLSGEVPHWT